MPHQNNAKEINRASSSSPTPIKPEMGMPPCTRHQTCKKAGKKLCFDDYCGHNAKFSDIVLRYGEDGSKEFKGHRVILCNKSEWFRKALIGDFKEAQAEVITLVDDNARALGAMFEYMYNNEYRPTISLSSEARPNQNILLQWLHILVVADKYMVEELVNEAIRRIDMHFTNSKSISFKTYAYIVQIVYGAGEVYDKEELADMDGKGTSLEDPSACPDWDISDCPIDENMHEWGEVMWAPPFERVKEVMLKVATQVWARRKEEQMFQLSDLANLAKTIPEFGKDLAVYALEERLTLRPVEKETPNGLSIIDNLGWGRF